jgi:hypothetical protein
MTLPPSGFREPTRITRRRSRTSWSRSRIGFVVERLKRSKNKWKRFDKRRRKIDKLDLDPEVWIQSRFLNRFLM